MSVNRSTPEFPDYRSRCQGLTTIADKGLGPKIDHFEITESLLMGNQESDRQRMDALRAAGCGIAIDDFWYRLFGAELFTQFSDRCGED